MRVNVNKLVHYQMKFFPKVATVAALSLVLLFTPNMISLHTASSAIAASTQSGIASWYGPGFNGRSTASGEIFDMQKLTAAHKTLPFGTRVKVTNLVNGKSVIVRINDRGPYVHGRVIDLSRAAASTIDLIASGTAPVQMHVLS